MTWRISILLMMLVLLVGCGGSAPTEGVKPAAARKDEVTLSAEKQREGSVEVKEASASDHPASLRVSGKLALADSRTWRVGIRTDGVVVTSNAGVGDFVRKGQVLATYQADEVRDARAQYRAAQADLGRAESAAALAQRGLDRAQRLLELKAGSVVQVEQARQDFAAGQADVRRAQSEVDRLKELLEDDLRVPAEPKPGDPSADRVPILAPASGYILQKNVTLGRAIHTDDDTFVIADLSELWMLASVRQEQLGLLRVGLPVVVTLNGAGGAEYSGRITNLGQELDPETRAMRVRIVLANPGNRLRPEMLATAAIPIGRNVSEVLVPSDAVQQIDGQDVVFVRVAPDRFKVRLIRTGPTSGGQTPVLEGLKAGEPVVVKGSFVLKSELLRASLEEGE